MKSYTDIEQSKKLTEILPLESADMCYKCIEDDPYDVICMPYSLWKEEYIGLLVRGDANVIPSWSLAALLSLIPEVSLNTFKDGKWNAMIQSDGKMIYTDKDNPVDACYELILKLHEQKLL